MMPMFLNKQKREPILSYIMKEDENRDSFVSEIKVTPKWRCFIDVLFSSKLYTK